MLKKIISVFVLLCLLPGGCAGLAEEALPAEPETVCEETGTTGTEREKSLDTQMDVYMSDPGYHAPGCSRPDEVEAVREYAIDKFVYTPKNVRVHTVTRCYKMEYRCVECHVVQYRDEELTYFTEEQWHIFNDDGICERCGSARCTHENADYIYEFDENSSIVYRPLDGRHHTKTGRAIQMGRCPDCYENFYPAGAQWEDGHSETEEHQYADGVCSLCGYVNTCQHENMRSWYYINGEAEYEPLDATYHSVTGTGSIEYFCDDCGYWEAIKGQSLDHVREEHKYINGVCRNCGYQCTHSHVEVSGWVLDNESVVWEAIDSWYCRMTGRQYCQLWCPDCFKRIETDEWRTYERRYTHVLNANGVCENCGYVNTCTHANKSDWFMEMDRSTSQYTAVDNACHNVTGRGRNRRNCRDCAYIEYGEWQEGITIRGNHEYYEGSDVCIFCGHVNTCEHANTRSWVEFYANAIHYTPADDMYHTMAGKGDVCVYCDDCEKYLSRETRDDCSELREHVFENGVCIECGYGMSARIDAPVVTVGATITGNAKLMWGPVAGATGYRVYRQKEGGTTWSLLKTTTNTSYTNTSGKAGTTYLYKVVALAQDAENNSQDSAVMSYTFPIASPGLAAAATAKGYAGLTWNAVEGAAGYRVYRQKSGGSTWSLLKTTVNTSYTNTSGKPGVTYLYKVAAYCDNAEAGAADSNIVSYTFPLASPELAVAATAKGYAGLTWNAVEGATGYGVYRQKEGSTKWTLLKTTSNTGYTNTSGAPGSSYSYKVIALAENGDANSESSIVSFTFRLAAPEVTVSASAKGKAALTWNAVEGAAGYDVYRQKEGSTKWTKLATTANTAYTNASGTNGVTYSYKVVALSENEGANSADSNIVSYTFTIGTPAVSVTATSAGNARLKWKAIDGATGYQVYRQKSGSATWTLLRTTTATSYTNTSGKDGVTYAYKVIALAEDESCNSHDSNVVSFTF